MTPRIKRAIDVFLEAVESGTLGSGKCTICAVGNLCAGDPLWSWGFITSDGWQSVCKEGMETDEFKRAIAKTEFTAKELMAIEFAFETNSKISSFEYDSYTKEEIREDQINGLRAVVEVMMEFDDVQFNVEELFVQRCELIPLK